MSGTELTSPIEDVVAFFASGPSRKDIVAFRLSKHAQERIKALLEKNRAGTLTSDEERELDRVMMLNDVVSLIQARAVVARGHSSTSSTSTNLPYPHESGLRRR